MRGILRECLEKGNLYEADVPHVAKVLELIGSSPNGWEDAVANAVKEVAKFVHDIKLGLSQKIGREPFHITLSGRIRDEGTDSCQKPVSIFNG